MSGHRGYEKRSLLCTEKGSLHFSFLRTKKGMQGRCSPGMLAAPSPDRPAEMHQVPMKEIE
jgi:hypothetical protein